MSRCTIAGSYSSEEGAGVYLMGGNPKLINCLLSGNWSGTNGGGLWIDGSDVDLQGCEFRGNEGSGAAGFGVTGFAADARAVNCIISGNKAFFGSGGVQILSGDLSLTNCTLNGNHCFAFEGGGLLVSGSNAPVEVNNCIIWKNYAGGTTRDAANRGALNPSDGIPAI
ncbi:MAG: right-handed parallel beta-helix repeat-containing protein [Roseibacillus sp.]